MGRLPPPPATRLAARLVCRRFRRVSESADFWRCDRLQIRLGQTRHIDGLFAFVHWQQRQQVAPSPQGGLPDSAVVEFYRRELRELPGAVLFSTVPEVALFLRSDDVRLFISLLEVVAGLFPSLQRMRLSCVQLWTLRPMSQLTALTSLRLVEADGAEDSYTSIA